ncbi:MAG: Uma2 family endonuclease [Anaerolineae bacterium]
MTVSEITYTPSGEIVATGVSEEEYLEKYAEHHCEWVNGTVIKMAPATLRHNLIVGYLYMLLNAYFARKSFGIVALSPFLQRLPGIQTSREPDLMIILNDNLQALTSTAMNGAADICIEVISPESVLRDRGEKFEEYERGGVGEYWIFDYQRSEALFYRRNSEGIFARQTEDADDNYRTSLLPALVINVPTLWREKLPDFNDIGKAVEAMLH